LSSVKERKRGYRKKKETPGEETVDPPSTKDGSWCVEHPWCTLEWAFNKASWQMNMQRQ
jgi:hypothetical protein